MFIGAHCTYIYFVQCTYKYYVLPTITPSYYMNNFYQCPLIQRNSVHPIDFRLLEEFKVWHEPIPRADILKSIHNLLRCTRLLLCKKRMKKIHILSKKYIYYLKTTYIIKKYIYYLKNT